MKNVLASGGGVGTLNYKNKPSLYFEVGEWNGYGGQYYVARSLSLESFTIGKTYVERTKILRKSMWKVYYFRWKSNRKSNG